MPFIPDTEITTKKNPKATLGNVSKFIPDPVQVDMNVDTSLVNGIKKTATDFTMGVKEALPGVKAAGAGLVSDIKQRGENVRQAAIQTGEALAAPSAYGPQSGEFAVPKGVGEKVVDVASLAGKTVGQIGRGVGDIFMRFFEAGTANVKPEQKQAILESKPVQDIKAAFSRENINPEVLSKVDAISQAAKNNPEVAGAVGDFFSVVTNVLGGGAAESAGSKAVTATGKAVAETVAGVKPALQAVDNFATKAGEKLSTVIAPIPGEVSAVASQSTKEVASDLQRINDIIAPKATSKQAALATEQGRLFKGKEATAFKKGTLDLVAPTDQQAKSTFTIKRLIPDAAKLDEPTLFTTLKDKVEEISVKLKPEMQKVPINEQTVSNITNDWNKLKTKQIQDALATQEPNVKKAQKQFEKFLQKSKSGTMNDLWETRQAYDDSISPSVKQATELSSEALQSQKDIWLENRRILSDAINSTENGLGDVSLKAFSDMRDLYEAKSGILTKAEINTTAAPSRARQYIEGATTKVIRSTGAGKLLP